MFLGVGFGMNPPKFLQPGNKMEVVISEIGTLSNEVKFA
jgi:2-keto-4-pentenoate hydratase/2-oxohepta-3-ene-1,7-dioic acid hydratase in catechol pathway